MLALNFSTKFFKLKYLIYSQHNADYLIIYKLLLSSMSLNTPSHLNGRRGENSVLGARRII